MKTHPTDQIWLALAPYINSEGGDVKRGMVIALADMRRLADKCAIDWNKITEDAEAEWRLIRDFGKYRKQGVQRS